MTNKILIEDKDEIKFFFYVDKNEQFNKEKKKEFFYSNRFHSAAKISFLIIFFL